jgi:hypothetical protein
MENEKTYKSVLGNKTWNFLHTLAYGLNSSRMRDKHEKANKLMESLQEVYPCEDCARGLKIINSKIKFKSNELPSETMLKLHNEVNKSIGKPNYGYDEIKNKYIYIK